MSEAGGLVEETNLGLMIAVPLFLFINASLAYAGGRLMSKMQHKSSEDVLTAHYLGGRSFGPVLSIGTMVRREGCKYYECMYYFILMATAVILIPNQLSFYF